jgi:antirestriction protein ArdC
MKDSVYQVITDRIVTLLEQGTIPWQKPWSTIGSGMPQNLLSQKAYRGVNVFLLNSTSYQSPYWLTFKQAKQLKGSVRRGEKSTPVVFWKFLEKPSEDLDKKAKQIPMLRHYNVFNVEQCDGVESPASTVKLRDHDAISSAEAISGGMPNRPDIRHGGSRACYRPSTDQVDIPSPESFRSAEEYYSTLFHELTHATGHESRLNRKGVSGSDGEWSQFGSTPYAKEELVAEMGAAFLGGHAGIVDRTIDNSAAYVSGWLERLRKDNRLVVTAAAQAQKAADFILDVHHEGKATTTSA